MASSSQRKPQTGSVSQRRHPPDLDRAREAIRSFVEALGFDPDDPALAITPDRTARAYAEVLTQGYDTHPADALGNGFPVSPGPVIAVDIPTMFVCPHHLLPARGVVHVGFFTKDRAPGLSRIAKMVDAASYRLILQEDLGHLIVEALVEALDAPAAVAVVDAQHTCVAVEDFARRETRFRTRATHGDADAIASLDTEINATLGTPWSTSASEPRVGPPRLSSPSS